MDVSICAFYGLEGGIINWAGIPILPKGLQPYGQDIAVTHAKVRGAKYIISLIDAWIFHGTAFFDNLANEGVRWLPWFPVDSEPIPPPVLEAVRRAYRRIVFSHFAAAQMQAAGVDCSYIPHGVDTTAYAPRDQLEARKELRELAHFPVADDTFLVGMVAANKGTPSRKAFAEQIAAFKVIKQRHPKALLYLHTSTGEQGEFGGINLPEYIRQVGLKLGDDVLFPGRYDYFMGFPDNIMRTLYSAMDVHMLASSGEGFGIPILEAQACGCPVIVGDWTAMSELCFSGWKIPKADAHPFWDAIGAYKFLPDVGGIVDKLEAAYVRRGNKLYRENARKGALEYDADRVTKDYWLPFLNGLIAEDEQAAAELEQVRQMMSKRITPRGPDAAPIQEGAKDEVSGVAQLQEAQEP